MKKIFIFIFLILLFSCTTKQIIIDDGKQSESISVTFYRVFNLISFVNDYILTIDNSLTYRINPLSVTKIELPPGKHYFYLEIADCEHMAIPPNSGVYQIQLNTNKDVYFKISGFSFTEIDEKVAKAAILKLQTD